MLKKSLLIVILLLVLLFVTACSSSRTVKRTDPNTQTDLRGTWNDTDSRDTAETMISDVSKRQWLNDFAMKHGRKPVVIVGTIRNFSDEHIETGTFENDIERELINGGNVKFVASKSERTEVRSEKQDQQTNASEETAKKLAKELGADFMLQGSIKTILDSYKNKTVKFYQVDMQLINVETSEKVWIGTHKIKKEIVNSKTAW